MIWQKFEKGVCERDFAANSKFRALKKRRIKANFSEKRRKEK